jgi:hypothetical protein
LDTIISRSRTKARTTYTPHVDCLDGIKYIGRLDRTMLGEGKRQRFGKLQTCEVATICDHLAFFFRGKLKHEILRKATRIALDRLVQCLGRDAIQRGQVSIDHYPMAPHEQNAAFNPGKRCRG